MTLVKENVGVKLSDCNQPTLLVMVLGLLGIKVKKARAYMKVNERIAIAKFYAGEDFIQERGSYLKRNVTCWKDQDSPEIQPSKENLISMYRSIKIKKGIKLRSENQKQATEKQLLLLTDKYVDCEDTTEINKPKLPQGWRLRVNALLERKEVQSISFDGDKVTIDFGMVIEGDNFLIS